MDYDNPDLMTADELLAWAAWNFTQWEEDNEASSPWYILLLWAERSVK